MKYRNKIFILLFAIFCQSFSLIDGSTVTLEQIKGDGKEKVFIIFSAAVACKACYSWLADKLVEVQKKYKCRIYVLSENKENVFQRKMVSVEVKRRLMVELNETYIFDDDGNEFMKKYKESYAPSLLYIYGNKEQYIAYKALFDKVGLNKKVIDRLTK